MDGREAEMEEKRSEMEGNLGNGIVEKAQNNGRGVEARIKLGVEG